MRVAAVQSTAGEDRADNLDAAGLLVEEAASAGAALVVLPEYFSVAGTAAVLRDGAEALDGPTMRWAATIAARMGIHLVAGSFPERPRSGDSRLSNTSCLVGPDGSTLAVYRKIHLFDVHLDGVDVAESDTFRPGDDVVVTALGSVGDSGKSGDPVVGLSLCYDIRFPELYRSLTLGGATVMTVPAAFTEATGPAHWELLLRARAVENQVFVVGAGQVGALPPGMPRCHGHSMVVDPWGVVLAERAAATPGVVLADLDFSSLISLRAKLPVLAHRRPAAYRGLHGDQRGSAR